MISWSTSSNNCLFIVHGVAHERPQTAKSVPNPQILISAREIRPLALIWESYWEDLGELNLSRRTCQDLSHLRQMNCHDDYGRPCRKKKKSGERAKKSDKWIFASQSTSVNKPRMKQNAFKWFAAKQDKQDKINAVFSLSRKIDLTGTLHAVLVC